MIQSKFLVVVFGGLYLLYAPYSCAQSFSEIVRELTGDEAEKPQEIAEPVAEAAPVQSEIPAELFENSLGSDVGSHETEDIESGAMSGEPTAGDVQEPIDPDFAPQKNVIVKNFILRGLDKKSARVFSIKAKIGQTISFGTLRINVKHCEHSHPEEHTESIAYMQITDEALQKKVFDGWMFASSPSISALDHKDYDIWLEKCVD